MWPRGNLHAQLATIDDRLARVDVALNEARAIADSANVAICQQRLDELRQERDRIEAMIPLPRAAAD
jgi:hypothetical protein